ncbi:MAG: hypothetical protein FWC16_00230 [Defluviitaleaceae bacterium]|nr:hypothetical protein [Defluviitaleaceae bacterium]MCL2273329.1 hypothetical protein [Defluviitaleaceae bacterium]
MGFSGLSIATSGLRVAHLNLGVTGHNMSNAEIKGFSRQRVVQKDGLVVFRGESRNGDRMVLGMGADRNAVQQLRNEFLDFTYRENVGRLHFYNALVVTGREIENMLGELYGAYNFQGVINDMWFAIQELSRHPDSFAVRNQMLHTSQSFLNKAREVANGLFEEQRNLNAQIIQTVSDVNGLLDEINRLNTLIRNTELAGDNANDFRDARNLALDRLAELIPMEVRIGNNGEKNIVSMGHELIAAGSVTHMGLRRVSADFDFVVPVLGTGGQTINADTVPGHDFIEYFFLRSVDFASGNDFGQLNALLLARGAVPAHHMSSQIPRPTEPLNPIDHPHTADWTPDQFQRDLWARQHNWDWHNWSVNNAMIPRVQQDLDSIVYAMVNMLNDVQTGQLREVNPQFNPADTFPSGVAPPRPYIHLANGTRVPNTAEIAAFRLANPSITDTEWAQLALLDGGRYRFVFREDHATHGDLVGNLGLPRAHWNLNGDSTAPPPDGVGSIPLFVRIHANENTPVDPANINSLWSTENLRINPLLLQPGGHNLLALSLDRDAVNDTRILEALQTIWRSNEGPYVVDIGGRQFRVQEAYVRLVNQISIDVNEAIRFVDNQMVQVIQADNQRQAIKGVSMDEELASMLRFQYAFQAASRVINVIDGMMGTIVNIGRN